jgi:hypothetical protein
MGKSKQQPVMEKHYVTPGGEAVKSPLDATIEATARHKSVLVDAANILGVGADKVCGLLRNVWTTSKGQSPLTDAEMFKGLSLIARYELDPIARDVYVTRSKDGRLLTIIGIDGWIKVLDRTEHYDGFEWDDETDANGKVIAVNVRIYSTKRSRPTTYRGLMSEYQRVGGVVAKDMPVHMLRLFSLRHAARLFTPIGGDVLTEEEARYVQDHHAEQSVVPSSKSKSEALADHLMNRMAEPAEEPELTPEPDPQEEAVEAADAETSDDNAAISWCEAIIARLGRASNVLQFSQIRDEVYAHPFRDELPQDAMDRLSAALTEAEKRCTE